MDNLVGSSSKAANREVYRTRTQLEGHDFRPEVRKMCAAQRPEQDITSRSCAVAVLGPMEVPGNRELRDGEPLGVYRWTESNGLDRPSTGPGEVSSSRNPAKIIGGIPE